jgi:hypothetical protein
LRYFAAWLAVCGCAFLFFGFEIGGVPLTTIDRDVANAPETRQESN